MVNILYNNTHVYIADKFYLYIIDILYNDYSIILLIYLIDILFNTDI